MITARRDNIVSVVYILFENEQSEKNMQINISNLF
jgi:hypothetical protein